MSHTAIVVPCYNEAQRLDARRFEQFAARTHGIAFLLVNDGSQDATLELLESLNAANPRRFSFLHLARNSGKAEAVRQGCLLALESRPAYLGYWDADLATPLEDIPTFAGVLELKPAVDMVVGCRLPLLGHKIERQPLRRALGRVFANVASVTLGLPIYDTQCGAKLFRVTPVLRQVLAEPFSTRWIFDVEILARLIVARRTLELGPLAEAIYEQPLDHWRDVAGSKVKGRDFVKAIREMGHIYLRYLRPGAGWTPEPLNPPTVPDRRRAA
jgi:dolichyl-phosphate beta-glucosyltransferase